MCKSKLKQKTVCDSSCALPAWPRRVPTSASVISPRDKVAPLGRERVCDNMTRNVITVAAETTLEQARVQLLSNYFTGMPVIDGQGLPVGVLSRTDILRALDEEPSRKQEKTSASHGLRRGVGSLQKKIVGEYMTPFVFTIPQNALLCHAAALMGCENVRRLVVVEKRRKLVGIITASDLVMCMARSWGFLAPPQQNLHAPSLS